MPQFVSYWQAQQALSKLFKKYFVEKKQPRTGEKFERKHDQRARKKKPTERQQEALKKIK